MTKPTELTRSVEEFYNDAHVEINPFLCSFTTVLPESQRPLRVVHLVRHPYRWISSMTGLKARGWRRNIVGMVPFNLPPAATQGHNKFGRLAWCWGTYNRNIASLRDKAQCYALVRFEDLFGNNSELAATAWRQIINTLELIDSGAAQPDFAARENINPNASGTMDLSETLAPSQLDRIGAIVAPLARQFGYEL